MQIEDFPGLSFRSLKLSAVDIFWISLKALQIVFPSFVIYDNSHLKENAMFAKGSLDITKPTIFFGLRFSRVKHNG